MALDVSRAKIFFCADLGYSAPASLAIPGRMKKQRKNSPPVENRGYFAQNSGQKLQSWTIGALPIVNGILDQMGFEQLLEMHLPPDGPRTVIPTSRAVMLLVRNILLSREPIYGVGEWAQRYAPDLLGITSSKLKHLNDDRVGRALDRLFLSLASSCRSPNRSSWTSRGL